MPQHFDLLLELIRTLARSTGGIGLRSAIRVIQDVLVDKSRVLGAEAVKLADRETGSLACVDDFYDTLRADIAKVLPHVIGGVDKTLKIFGSDSMELRVAKAVAALQPVETFPPHGGEHRRFALQKSRLARTSRPGSGSSAQTHLRKRNAALSRTRRRAAMCS